ncbi:Uncharacterised protein [Dermatophilus congolensis]|uniref:Uncharacterized protein n=1 Tax=Dermatophilus congolensis TaxID=1863 RepID=A0A239VMH2_9MICO|nr:Uncharacterised protein [Dermatophilus congolensis]
MTYLLLYVLAVFGLFPLLRTFAVHDDYLMYTKGPFVVHSGGEAPIS